MHIRRDFNCTYPMGQDSIWGITRNKINLTNSIKMKLAVIMGILHMSIGIVMKGTNTIYFGRFVDFWTEVVTGLVILLGLFGWMDLLIVAKWFHKLDIENQADSDTNSMKNRYYYDTDDEIQKQYRENFNAIYQGDVDNRNTPSIINIMITQVFSFGNYKTTDPDNKMAPLVGGSNDTQYGIGVALVIIVVILVPVMLCTKPIIAGCSQDHSDEDQDEIEFTNINRGDDMSQPLQPGIQNRNSDGASMDMGDDSRKITDDMMLKRQREMQSLERQLKAMGAKGHGNEGFGEVFIH